MHSLSWTFRPVFTTLARVPKTRIHPCPVPSRAPAPRLPVGRQVSLSQALPWAFASWGILLRQGLWPGRLLQLYLREHLAGFLVPPACRQTGVSIFRDCRTMLYAVSHISSGYHVPRYIVAEWGQVPFWACRLPIQALSRSAGSNSRRLRTFVENPVHSHLLGPSPLPASSLSPFTPCTPTFDDQSPAVG